MDDVRLKENRTLWSKIVRLVFTDFLCWVPICIMSFLSFSGFILPSIVYPVTAVILVPINSAANPWLYSSFLADFFKTQWDSNLYKRLCLDSRASNSAPSNGVRQHNVAIRRRRRRRPSNERSMSITLTSRVSVIGINSTDNPMITSTNL